ncbi:hypothetical protein ACU8V7_02260 [Zobellia nedashkovskayae]
MKTTNLGYPRIGSKRELKRALEQYWSGKTSIETLLETAKGIRKENWLLQKEQGIDLIPSNDFSLYRSSFGPFYNVGVHPRALCGFS